MATKTCLNCGSPLTGRQRKWCSDACRKRAARRKQRVRESSKTSGKRPPSPGRMVQMRLVVDSQGLYPYLYKSGGWLRMAIYEVLRSEAVQKMLIDELEHRIPGYQFRIVILPGPW